MSPFSNGYLEYDAVTRLGISDPKQYIRKRFPDSGLVFLSSCCISGSIVEQMEVAVEEALNSGSWVDILPLLPSVLGPEDARQLVQTTLANRSSSPSSGGALLLADCCVLSRSLISSLVGSQEAGMDARAQKDVESGAVAQSLVDQGADGVEEVIQFYKVKYSLGRLSFRLCETKRKRDGKRRPVEVLEAELKGDRLRPSRPRIRRKGGGGRMMTGQMMKMVNKGEEKVVGGKQEREERVMLEG